MTDKAHPLGPDPEGDDFDFDPASPVYQIVEVLVSPKLAAAILETRAPNRPIRDRTVAKYARDMIARRWLRNGQTIKFDIHGRLLDGQHRLWAIIEADIAVDMTVALGLEPESMATVDTGIPRSFGDVLAINGTGNARQVASVIRLIWQYENGLWSNAAPSHLDLGATASRFPELNEQVAVLKGKAHKLGSASTVLFVSIMGARLSKQKYEQWIEGLVTGSDLQAGHPVLAFREKLLTWRAEKNQRFTKPDYAVSLAIKAWNAHVAGREIHKLQWQQTREPRPVFDPAIPGLRQPAPERRLPDKE